MGTENTYLKPCPFCGDTEPTVGRARSRDPHDQREFWHACCQSCEARGSLKIGLDTACVAWNVGGPLALSEDAFSLAHDAGLEALKSFEASLPRGALTALVSRVATALKQDEQRCREALIPLAKNADFYKPEIPDCELVTIPLLYLRQARKALKG